MSAAAPIIAGTEFLDPTAYLREAEAAAAAGERVAEHALLRCARTLGASVSEEALTRSRLTDDQLMGRGSLYQRNMRVVDLIESHFGAGPLSIADIGGGSGILAHMAPEADYFLCEPSLNGATSFDLIEAGREFDVVVAIHVFEHIPDADKRDFFASLVKLARRGVVLCNPTDTGTAVERQKFLIDVYGPLDWLVEHLECGTPTIPLFEDLAAENDLRLSTYPNGNELISMAQFAMTHFAAATGDPEMMRKCGKLMRYINARRASQDSQETPRDYAFVFEKT